MNLFGDILSRSNVTPFVIFVVPATSLKAYLTSFSALSDVDNITLNLKGVENGTNVLYSKAYACLHCSYLAPANRFADEVPLCSPSRVHYVLSMGRPCGLLAAAACWTSIFRWDWSADLHIPCQQAEYHVLFIVIPS